MKVFVSLLLVSVVVMIAVDAYESPIQKPHPNAPKLPTSPGKGPFNPHIRPHVNSVRKPRPQVPTFPGQASFNPYARPIRFRRSLLEERGKINISGGVKKESGKKPNIHVSGSIHKG